jgi:BirA family biotin operon repressor/biotin-[acetyl-CoA-carboxylase] ligase
VTAADELAERLRDALGAPWPAPIEHHASLGSTNDRLKELAREGASEWAVVVADAQTAGRGRQGHAWVSPAGNLYLSTLLRPRGGTLSLLPLLAGIGAAEALEGFGACVALKWPNDLMLDGRKLGGLLAESSSAATGVEWVVVGLGINLETAPLGFEASATTLREAGVAAPSRNALLAAVLARWRVWYHRFTDNREDEILQAWRARALPWWGSQVRALRGGQPLEGRAIDVDASGGLVVELDGGRRVILSSGEVTLLRREP